MPTIRFNYFDEYAFEVHERPVPSKETIPKWYKDLTPYIPDEEDPKGGKLKIHNRTLTNASAKKCTPMLDAIISGYTIRLWADIVISKGDIKWRTKNPVFASHGLAAKDVPAPYGYHQKVLKYLTGFRVETEPGYSIVVGPPAGYPDSPFLAVPGIIDTDSSVIDTNIPMWMQTDFEGIVKAGTPIAQIFPFQREDWKAEFTQIPFDKFEIEVEKGFAKTAQNNYVKNHWTQKKFD